LTAYDGTISAEESRIVSHTTSHSKDRFLIPSGVEDVNEAQTVNRKFFRIYELLMRKYYSLNCSKISYRSRNHPTS